MSGYYNPTFQSQLFTDPNANNPYVTSNQLFYGSTQSITSPRGGNTNGQVTVQTFTRTFRGGVSKGNRFTDASEDNFFATTNTNYHSRSVVHRESFGGNKASFTARNEAAPVIQAVKSEVVVEPVRFTSEVDENLATVKIDTNENSPVQIESKPTKLHFESQIESKPTKLNFESQIVETKAEPTPEPVEFQEKQVVEEIILPESMVINYVAQESDLKRSLDDQC